MNDQINILKDDIAFMRALAAEGRTPPSTGGAYLASAGVIYSIASVAQWAQLQHLAGLTPNNVLWVWLAAFALQMASVIALKRSAAKAGPVIPSHKASGMAWQGMGFAIFTLVVSVVLIAWRTQSAIPTLLLPPMILALYGAAWSVAAVVSTQRWMGFTAGASFIGALITAWFSTSSAELLIYAGALTLLATLPGIILMRSARQARA